VAERRVGRENLYRLTAEPLAEVGDWLAFYEDFWRDRLRKLGGALAELAASADEDQEEARR